MLRKYFFMVLAPAAYLCAQNPLIIPDTLSGTDFNLTVQTGTRQFFAGYTTNTYGINGNFLGPTLFVNKDDTVTLNVTNQLNFETTMHWHGLHVPPEFDGGPHQPIAPSGTWSPKFRIMNNAGTFWYHPHGHGSTELQVTKGLAGMLIVRDDAEAALNLPRTYGVDDFPIILQSRAFDVLYQIAGFTHDDTVMMVNGTINPYLNVPAQMVRLRLLNGSVDRAYQIGLSNDSNFYQIGSDGGLLAQPYLTNRVQIAPGERAEVVVNLSGLQGQTIYLVSYASELPNGVMGSANVSMGMATLPGYNANPLNGNDFNLLALQVVAPTASPVTSIPPTLVSIIPLVEGSENTTRNFVFSPQTMGPQQMIEGPFTINGALFDMNVTNDTTYLNHTEIWSLINTTAVAHPFHIHDVQFYVLDRNGIAPGPAEGGLKDVVLVHPNETVRFITRFEDFHNAVIPYMYHCHLLHHEDEGMMGSFIVLDSATLSVPEPLELAQFNVYPNPAHEELRLTQHDFPTVGAMVSITNISGQKLLTRIMTAEVECIDVRSFPAGIYLLTVQGEGYFITKKIIIN